MKKIKSATVKILIEDEASGTGFFINESGKILTCWHVIEPACVRDPAKYNGIVFVRKLGIQLENGEKIEYGIAPEQLNDVLAFQSGLAYDFCVLYPTRAHSRRFPFLKLGSFNALEEGDQIYTCGYPLGMETQFVSSGMASTKYTNGSNRIITNGVIKSMARNESLLDLTMNRGNSGGAVMKVGKTANDDEVIGIADFIITPAGHITQQVIDQLKDTSSGKMTILGVNPNYMFAILLETIKNYSIGISGCVSIDHYLMESRRRGTTKP